MMRPIGIKQITGRSPLPESVMERIKLIQYADANHVLGQMASVVNAGAEDRLGEVFRNALLRAEHDHRMLQFEMNRLEHALTKSDIEPIVLKGGAYVALRKKAGNGRRVSDLDILVDEDQLVEVETLLKEAGWETEETTDNPYDQSYYREHMHELPPLRHRKRGTIIDIHHRLLPRTARYNVDVNAMRKMAVPLEGVRLKTFNDVDLFIHSAVHAFGDGSFDAPARSLVELSMLYEELSEEDQKHLPQRASDVGAAIPVSVALWAIGCFFSIKNALTQGHHLMKFRRHYILRWAIKSKTLTGRLSTLAKAFLYIRSHYLRMPLYLLIPHLTRKAFAWRPLSKKPVELPFP